MATGGGGGIVTSPSLEEGDGRREFLEFVCGMCWGESELFTHCLFSCLIWCSGSLHIRGKVHPHGYRTFKI